MILSAQKIIYWPKMQAAIPQESVKCSLCASVIVRRSRENRCCLLNSFGRTYSTKEGSMICCCGRLLHYSDWFEVNLLNEDMTATSLSKKKHTLSAMVCRINFMSDNGPQYTSQEF